MVMEENESYATVVGNTTDWPNLNSLIANGALPTNYYANTHPSIGNYFMLTTGQILTNDDSSTAVWNVDNLARRMLAARISFKIYAEGITQGYLGGDTGLYVIRHNPFAMLSDVANNAQVANAVIWPFSQFAAGLGQRRLTGIFLYRPRRQRRCAQRNSAAGGHLAADQRCRPVVELLRVCVWRRRHSYRRFRRSPRHRHH